MIFINVTSKHLESIFFHCRFTPVLIKKIILMKKQQNEGKLSLKKFQIARINNAQNILGGGNETTGNETTIILNTRPTTNGTLG